MEIGRSAIERGTIRRGAIAIGSTTGSRAETIEAMTSRR
jgi:hypothetical protein